MDNAEQLKKLSQIFNADRIVSKEDIEAVLAAIVNILADNKKSIAALNTEAEDMLRQTVQAIANEHNSVIQKVQALTNDTRSDVLAKVDTEIKEAQTRINELVEQVRSVMPKDGKDADEELIVAEVLKQIKLPEYKEVILDDGEQIVAKINSLPQDNEDLKIDAVHIKNLPQAAQRVYGGTRMLSKLVDVRVTDIANNDVLKWNSTTGRFENGQVSGGSGTIDGSGTTNQISYWVDSDTLGALTTATYPSLTELSYVKGVTSAIQTQINAKGDALTTNPLSQFAATTSLQLKGVISDETGSGSLVFATSPTLVTPVLGVASATSINKVAITAPATGSTLTIIDGKTLTVNKTMSFTAADDTGVYTLPTGTKTLLATDGAGTSLTGIPYSLTGTANQVNLSAATGNITFSLPQSIATSSTPQFARLGLGVAADASRLLLVQGDVSGGVATLERQNASTNAAVGTAIIKGTSTGDMVDGFGPAFQFAIQDTAAVENIIAAVKGLRNGADNTGKITFSTYSAGVIGDRVEINASGLSPSTTDGLALGSTSLMWSDLFLASGAVINFNNGNATLTHSAGLLTSNVSLSLGTSNVLTTGTIELGAASDTTLSRSSAGVLAVEGVVIPSISSTNTLTNKRITPRVSTTTSSATPTINTDNVDMYGLTAQTADITSFTTNLSGTPTDGQKLWIYIVGTAARAITWGSSFEASTVALPTTTVSTNRLDVGFVWNAATSKWRCIAQA